MTAPETMAAVLARTQDPAWTFTVDGFEPIMESSVESRFAISNGFLGVRAARSPREASGWWFQHAPMWRGFLIVPVSSR